MKSAEDSLQSNLLHKNYLLNTLFTNLKAAGFSPKHIVDVGANHGTWTREALKYFPDAYYTLIEPQNWLKPSFQDLLNTNKKITYHAVGAGSQSGSFKFTIVEQDHSCSFKYTEEEALKNDYKQVEIPIVTLNELLGANSKLPTPDIIKIDAEGLDIEVLKGASDFLGKTEVFMVEAGVVTKEYDNSILKVMKFMDGNGYRLFDITDLNRPFVLNILWMVELDFVRINGSIDSYKFNK